MEKRTGSNIHTLLLQIYIVLTPFVNAFSPTSKLPLPLIFLFVSCAVLCLRLKGGEERGRGLSLFALHDDYLLLLTFSLSIVMVCFSFSCVNEKTFNHIFAILTVLGLFYFFVRYLVSRVRDLDLVFACCSRILFFVSAYIIFEFLLSQLTGIKLDDYIYRPTVETLEASVLDGLFMRPRGFAEEPGAMALFFEVFIPLSLVHLRRCRKTVAVPYCLVVAVAFLMLFSAASIGSLLAVAGGFLLVALFRGTRLRWNLKTFSVAALLLLVTLQFHEVIGYYVREVALSKFLGLMNLSDTVDSSSADRGMKYAQFYDLFASYPFGIGWGIAASSPEDYRGITIPVGFVSLYAEILAASGVVGGGAFLLFLWCKVRRAWQIGNGTGKYLLFALLWTLLHYLFVSIYWVPWIWFLIALVDVLFATQLGRACAPVAASTGAPCAAPFAKGNHELVQTAP